MRKPIIKFLTDFGPLVIFFTIYFKGEKVGFSDDFIGLRIEDEKTEAIRFLVDNEDRLKLCLWNIPKKERMW